MKENYCSSSLDKYCFSEKEQDLLMELEKN